MDYIQPITKDKTMKVLLGLLLLSLLTNVTNQVNQRNWAEVLAMSRSFYYGQMTGDLPNWFPLNWRGPCFVDDGKDVGLDLSRSFFDCGDHVVFGHPLSYTTYMMGLIILEYKPTLIATGEEYTKLLQLFRWGTDFWIRAHPEPNVLYGQIGIGELDHTVWVPCEFGVNPRPSMQINTTHPGADLSGNVAATLAMGYLIFKDKDPNYATTLLRHARELYTFSTTYPGKYSDSITNAASFYASGGYVDEQLLASLALYWATGEKQYSDYAYKNSRDLVQMTLIWGPVWDDASYANVYLLWKLLGDVDAKKVFLNWGDFWATKLQKTPGGLSYLTSWGSTRYPPAVGFFLLAYLDNNTPTTNSDNNRKSIWESWILGQMDYILGNNPLGISYLNGYNLDGYSLNNSNYVKTIHHRGAHGSWNNSMDSPKDNRHINFGIAGPNADDTINTARSNYVNMESGNDYLIGLVGVSAALVKRYGGQSKINFPPPEPIGEEYTINGLVVQNTSKVFQVNLLIINHSGWPPRSPAVKFRYFVNVSELLSQGKTPNDLLLDIYYKEDITVGPLTQYNGSSCVYYIEGIIPAGILRLGGTTESQKQCQLTWHSAFDSKSPNIDPTNDWSAFGLSQNPGSAINVPLYEQLSNGAWRKVWGEEPAGNLPCFGSQPNPVGTHLKCTQCVWKSLAA